MRAKLSVVMPTLNAAAGLRRSLPALSEGLEAGLIRELVISDGGSNDATLNVADEAGAEVAQGPPSRGGQLRRGANVAKGDWMLFLHADSILPEGWADCVMSHIAAHQGPAVFRLRFQASGIMAQAVARWANFRTQAFGLPYGDQGLLISRQDYNAVGGYQDIPLMEDVALARALRGRITLFPLAVITSAARYEQDGWIRRGVRNLWLLTRYLLGADPNHLIKRY